MPLERVRIRGFRCLAELDVALRPDRNYFFGPNGAGKTSILEAVFLLGRGRSFRTRQARTLVRRGGDAFSVFGEIRSRRGMQRIGVQYVQGRLEKRIDGTEARGSAALAELLPVHVIDASAHALIEGGPADRRRFLDWGVFHVEQSYLGAWKQYRRLLSQRNAALKGPARPNELRAWTNALLEAGQVVHEQRLAYTRLLADPIAENGQVLLQRAVTVDYLPGWHVDLTFDQALRSSERRDRLSGNTEVGPHRADLEVRLDGAAVDQEASRGQQKLVAAGLILAQALVQARSGGGGEVLLVDDPAAELDRPAVRRLLALLATIPAQQLLTGIEPAQLAPTTGFGVFHVERGQLQAV